MSVDELAKEIFVSIPTIRRDLISLEKEGSIKRTHGGATSINNEHVILPFMYRNKINLEEKEKIGYLASKLVKDGDYIFLEGSTTCLGKQSHWMKIFK